MKKKEIQKRVLHNGEMIKFDDFTWDKKKRIFSSKLNGIVLEFSEINFSTINVGNYSTIKAGLESTIKSGFHSMIYAGSDSKIKTGSKSIIKTCDSSTIYAGEKSVCVRSDIFEFFKIPTNKKIKINEWLKRGYTFIENHTIKIDGKELKLSNDSYNELKEFFKNN